MAVVKRPVTSASNTHKAPGGGCHALRGGGEAAAALLQLGRTHHLLAQLPQQANAAGSMLREAAGGGVLRLTTGVRPSTAAGGRPPTCRLSSAQVVLSEGAFSCYYILCICVLCAPHTAIHVSSYYCICVLILLCMCPHAVVHVSSYYYVCVCMLLCRYCAS